MTIWILNYFYTILIFFTFFLIPIYILYNNRNGIREKKGKLIFISNFIFSLFIILLFLLKEYHITTILDICFKLPLLEYKTDIPKYCYEININEYMGIGSILTLFLWIIVNLIYSLLLYFVASKFIKH